MDKTSIVVLALLALITITAFFIYRRRCKVDLKGPLGTRLKLDGSNEAAPSQPGVKIEKAKSREGSLLAEDRTGRGSSVKDVDVKGDIRVSSSPPGQPPDTRA